MADFDQPGEELDENLPADYPPDRPLGLYDEEATGIDEEEGEEDEDEGDLGFDEPEATADEDDDEGDDEFEAGTRPTEPEAWQATGGDDDGRRAPTLAGDADVGVVDDEKDLVAPPVEREGAGPLAADDEFSGDETTRDVATEHVPRPAEEAAVRYDDEPPGATG